VETTQRTSTQTSASTCYHCGNNLGGDSLLYQELHFCCEGCRTVFSILQSNNLGTYYELNDYPGVSRFNRQIYTKAFDVLEDVAVASSFIQFKNNQLCIARFYIPAIHCTSCIWLLENLVTIDKNIFKSSINFQRKEAFIHFNPAQTSLKEIAILLAGLGYEPHLSLNDLGKQREKNKNRTYYYKLGVAFFALGNIMLLAFPEYLGMDAKAEHNFSRLFGYISIVLSLPVLFFSAQDFFKSAWSGLKLKTLNIDFPIALGILVMFIRSLFEIITASGAGYLDTMASLVFLMLVGRRFQNLSYDKLSFERDYKSYFPLSVTKIINEQKEEKQTLLSELKTGDRILVRNQEIIPADAILLNGQGCIDYSFVTGEENPVTVMLGEIVYAGGKQTSSAIEIEIIKPVSQSYLTQLWNEQSPQDTSRNINTITNNISKYFSIIVLIISLFVLVYWWQTDLLRAINAFTAVLIITCPCALALSAPFAFGFTIRGFSRNGFYVKNALVIEQLNKADTLVFDKTGTLTSTSNQVLNYYGSFLDNELSLKIYSICKNSSHPLSRKIASLLQKDYSLTTDEYRELSGKGILARIGNQTFCIGSAAFITENTGTLIKQDNLNTSVVYLAVNKSYYGYFEIKNTYRPFISTLFNTLKNKYAICVLSGDNDSEKETLQQLLPVSSMVLFNQSPFNKKEFITSLNKEGKNTVMLGDGLNDSGALKVSHAGIAITDDINNFTPASDAILEGKNLFLLPQFLKLSSYTIKVIVASFIISFLYNLVGLYFAVQGTLTPLFAAILMPLSSVSVVVFITIAIKWRLNSTIALHHTLYEVAASIKH